jgi:hypothetical protein
MRTKVQELGIFAIGIGILLAALLLWLMYATSPQPGRERSSVFPAVTLSICAICVVLGVLTLRLKSRLIIQLTVAVLILGFIAELLISFNVIKAIISACVIWLIIKTGREALKEVGPTTAA